MKPVIIFMAEVCNAEHFYRIIKENQRDVHNCTSDRLCTYFTGGQSMGRRGSSVGCALTFASEAKFEIEAKISFRLEVKKKPDFT